MAKTITTYLMTDNPSGSQYVLISNKICKMLIVPRSEMDTVNERKEFNTPCLYMLLGGSDADKQAYIGQTESFRKRVAEHKKNKEFWNKALIFISNDASLTKSDVQYLEYIAIKEAKSTNMYNLPENKQIPTQPSMPEHLQEPMNEFYNDVKFLTAFAGCDIFMRVNKVNKQTYYLSSRGCRGEAYFDFESNRLILLKGSILAPNCSKSFGLTAANIRREEFIRENCKIIGGQIVLQKDYAFTSPSAAADFCVGNSTNGWDYWKDKNGKSLDENIRKKVIIHKPTPLNK